LPGVVPLGLLLVNTGRVAVWVGEAAVYPTGLLLKVALHGREPAPRDIHTGTGAWRFGVQFSDGRKATVFGLGLALGAQIGGRASTVTALTRRADGSPPEAPLLQPRGGGGGQTLWRQEYWLWPLPPPGDLLLACEWPNAGIEFSTATISADLLLEAAGRASELWPAPDLPEWPGPGHAPGIATGSIADG
jgi:hypothetical protein